MLPAEQLGGALCLDKMGNTTVLTTPSNAAHEFEYNAVNRNSAYDTPLSGSYVYSYDRDRRLTRVAFPSGTRDAAGNIATRTETVAGVTHDYAYIYGNVGRLTQATRDGVVVESYAYAGPGTGRTSETNTLRGLTNRAYAYDAEDHLTSAGDATFTYDADGFLASKAVAGQTTNYQYSSRGELLRVDLPSGNVVAYTHDPLGRRIAKALNGTVTEKYLWQGRTRLLAVYDGNGSLKQRFEYADGRMPVAMTVGGTRYFLIYDQVGSLRAVTNASGGVVKTVDYDSFGNVIADSNAAFKTPFGFAGGLYDTDTGLTRFGFRDYDADVGRWTAKDPIGFEDGDTDLYGYVVGDPVNFVDPEGKLASLLAAAAPVVGAIAEALGAAAVFTSEAVIGTSIGAALANVLLSKGGKQNIRDSGLTDWSDDDIQNALKDKSLSPNQKGRLNKEQKARDQRNKQKRQESIRIRRKRKRKIRAKGSHEANYCNSNQGQVTMDKNYNSKLDDIPLVRSKLWDAIKELVSLCDDPDGEIRCKIIESFSDIRTKQIEECVCRLLKDEDELVRIACLEVLNDWEDAMFEDEVLSMLADKSELVRSAAIVAIAHIEIHGAADTLISMIETCEEEEKVRIYYALCQLGREEYFSLFLNGLYHSFYRIRCATTNLLTNLITKLNKNFIINILSERILSETSRAAKTTMESAVSYINELEL